MGEHLPQALLELLRVGGFQHLVLADHVVRIDRLVQARVRELPSRDVRENHTMAPRERELALVRALLVNQLRVLLERTHDLDCTMARLFQRIDHCLVLAVRGNVKGLL
jgi:hypothetical protein